MGSFLALAGRKRGWSFFSLHRISYGLHMVCEYGYAARGMDVDRNRGLHLPSGVQSSRRRVTSHRISQIDS